jgi:predicted nucleotidyltransferase
LAASISAAAGLTPGSHTRPREQTQRDLPDPNAPSPNTLPLLTGAVMQKKRQSPQIMQQSLAAVLLPGYRRSVLGLLFLRPDEAFHGREIARRTGLPAGTVTRELRRLADVGLLERESRGNQVVYRANRKSPVFEEVAGILRKTSGLADEIKRALDPLASQIRVGFVFGSMASGMQQQGSDVDIIVIGSIDFGTVAETLYPLQKSLGREINPKVFSVREWNATVRDRAAFTADLLTKPKVFLKGDEDELRGLDRKESRSRRTDR